MRRTSQTLTFLLAPLSIALLLRSLVDIDRFDGHERIYAKLGVSQELVRFSLGSFDPQRGGQLNVNYSYLEELATDTTWGAGIRRIFGESGIRDLTACTAVQIKVRGDGTYNSFHFELGEFNEKFGICQADSETWASPRVSLSSPDWQTMVIPISHFRRLADAESRQSIGDYFEGDSCLVPKVERYHLIFTGKAETDTAQNYLHLREFKGIDAQPVAPLPPVIDDFELNSTVPYPVPFGDALPRIQYNWSLAQSGETALQVYFNPFDTELPGSAKQGGVRTILPEVIDQSNYSSIGFYLRGDASSNSLRLQLVQTDRSGGMKIIESPPVALENSAWQFIELPLLCFSTLVDSRAGATSPLFLAGYNFVFAGGDAPDERTDFIFIDALQLRTGVGDERTTTLPVIDTFEDGVRCGYVKFGVCFLDWTTSSKAIHGNESLAITYRHDCPDSVANSWGAGLRRILPREIDLRYYKTIEFDLMGDASQNRMRLELVESQLEAGDGETWASDFIDLDHQAWQHISLSLDEDFHLLLDRTDDIHRDYVAGNQTRNHRFSEYHLVFTGEDVPPSGSHILFDHLRVSGRQAPDRSRIIDSLIISEPRFSPHRSNVIFKIFPNSGANVSRVTLKIYRISGEQVAELTSNALQDAGQFVLQWDGRNNNGMRLPNGVYMVLVRARDGAGREQDGLEQPKFVEILK